VGRGARAPVPADAHSPNNLRLLDGARALGWRRRGAEINARGCVRAGFCGIGCRYDAKQGTLVTYVPRALAAGATLFADAEAVRVERRERGAARPRSARHARVDGGRATLTVDAPRVVLAGGAVGTPALLQRSALGGGAVGRWLRLHPTTAVAGAYDAEIAAGSGMPMTTICDEFSAAGRRLRLLDRDAAGASDARRGGDERLRPAARRAGARLPAPGHVHRARARRRRPAPSSGGGDRGPRRARAPRATGSRPPTRATCARGWRAPRGSTSPPGAREARTLHTEAVVARREADVAAILAASTAPNDVSVFSAHVNGTARLGARPRARRGGVRERAGALRRALRRTGVYVADGSLLPTGSA
jgi:hypothetical protein